MSEGNAVAVEAESDCDIGWEDDSGVSFLSRSVNYLRRLVGKGGPAEADYDELNAWIRSAHQAVLRAPEIASALRAALGDALSKATMQGFALLKPHGYAGDFEIIDRIYCEHTAPERDLRAWDEYFHRQAAPAAVRNRKRYFLDVIRAEVILRGPGATMKVLNVASGPGRDVHEYLRKFGESVEFTCVERDARAVAYARTILGDQAQRVRFVNCNAMTWRNREAFDLVWCSGLFDYFTDDVFVRMLRRLLSWTREGGKVIVGNFSTCNPSRPYMELVGEWYLKHRTEDELKHLAEQAGACDGSVSVFSEPLGVNLFLHVGKTVGGRSGLPLPTAKSEVDTESRVDSVL